MTVKSAIESCYPSLSVSQKKIARYMSEHYDDMLFLSIAQLAKKTEISPASIVRFARTIGFGGYTDMQKSIQSEVVITKPQEEAAQAAPNEPGTVSSVYDSLTGMYKSIDTDQLGRICDALFSARDVLIIGYMDSFGTAAELLHRLYGMRDNVHFSRLINDWNDILNLMNPKTLILAVSFAPHYTYTHTCVKTAKARGSRVILLTDSLLNPFSGLTDETVLFRLARSGKEHGREQLDVSPVFAYIQFLSCYILKNHADKLMEANRYHEQYVDA